MRALITLFDIFIINAYIIVFSILTFSMSTMFWLSSFSQSKYYTPDASGSKGDSRGAMTATAAGRNTHSF